jgi:hypothetical protein
MAHLLLLFLLVLHVSAVQTGHPAFMYVVSELLKVFASEPAADTNMGHILVALLRGGCQKLTTLQVNVHNLMCAALYCAVLYCTVQYSTVLCTVMWSFWRSGCAWWPASCGVGLCCTRCQSCVLGSFHTEPVLQ